MHNVTKALTKYEFKITSNEFDFRAVVINFQTLHCRHFVILCHLEETLCSAFEVCEIFHMAR